MAADRHQTKPYPLRLPDELRERLEAEAKASGRSLNQEIAMRLEASLPSLEDQIAETRRAELAALNEKIRELTDAIREKRYDGFDPRTLHIRLARLRRLAGDIEHFLMKKDEPVSEDAIELESVVLQLAEFSNSIGERARSKAKKSQQPTKGAKK